MRISLRNAYLLGSIYYISVFAFSWLLTILARNTKEQASFVALVIGISRIFLVPILLISLPLVISCLVGVGSFRLLQANKLGGFGLWTITLLAALFHLTIVYFLMIWTFNWLKLA